MQVVDSDDDGGGQCFAIVLSCHRLVLVFGGCGCLLGGNTIFGRFKRTRAGLAELSRIRG